MTSGRISRTFFVIHRVEGRHRVSGLWERIYVSQPSLLLPNICSSLGSNCTGKLPSRLLTPECPPGDWSARLCPGSACCCCHTSRGGGAVGDSVGGSDVRLRRRFSTSQRFSRPSPSGSYVSLAEKGDGASKPDCRMTTGGGDASAVDMSSSGGADQRGPLAG